MTIPVPPSPISPTTQYDDNASSTTLSQMYDKHDSVQVKMSRTEEGVIVLKQSPSSHRTHIWMDVYISYTLRPHVREIKKIMVYLKRNCNVKTLIDIIKLFNPIMSHNKIRVYRGDANGVAKGLLLDHDQIISELGITNLCLYYEDLGIPSINVDIDDEKQQFKLGIIPALIEEKSGMNEHAKQPFCCIVL